MNFRYLSCAIFVALVVLFGKVMHSQTATASTPTQQRPFVRDAVLAGRNFPLLVDLLQNAHEHDVLAKDPQLRQLSRERWEQIAEANQRCVNDLACKSKAIKFSSEQIQVVSLALQRIYAADASFRGNMDRLLVVHAAFTLSPDQTSGETLVEVWKRSAEGLNQIIATYAEGLPPRYKEVDGLSYQADSRTYAGLVRIIMDGLSIAEDNSSETATGNETVFFEPTLRFAIRLLQANSRDEAGRSWPLDTGENAAAIQAARRVEGSRYPYSTIVVPGAGSEIPGVALSPWGKERLRLAVDTYRQKLAPLILVTGGFVHPSQTPYCEAIEMKRFLMEEYGIPEAAILVDPYARHTTTNLRNAAREIYAYELPDGRSMLIVSDTAQTDYIQGSVFQQRSKTELGYLPVTLGKRLSSSRLEAMPSRESLLVDPLDPLDP